VPNYVALLRAVNVGGNAPVKMAALKESFAALGYAPVATHLQSGNVVFGAQAAPATLKQAIERRLAKDFELSIPVLVLAQDELARVAAANPFASEPGMDRTKLHVTFLFQPPDQAGLARLAAAVKGKDRCAVRSAVVYLHCPDGYGRSKLANAHLERLLGVPATTRNWNTVSELVRLASA
jgi:uncharacterized protein (DUF1697 family)